MEVDVETRVTKLPASARALRGPPLLALLGVLLAATVTRATAGACGDDVGGVRVACACGDVVVSNTVLWATDPVVTESCAGDGLVLQAPGDADGIRLDLDGRSITGRGYGVGIRIGHGGRLGSILVGGEGETRAEIANFGTGIRASGRSALLEVRSIDVHGNVADGLSIHASGVTLADVRSHGNGRDGVALSGHGTRVVGLRSDGNARDGLNLRGRSADVEGSSIANGRDGVRAGGSGHRLAPIRTRCNRGAGVSTSGRGHEVDEIRATSEATGAAASCTP